jgi:periplasmic divalent cation tolerance protein
MKRGSRERIVLITSSSLVEARKIAGSVVGKRLAACASALIAPVESVYRWKGKVEKAREYLLILKTTAGRLGPLEAEVARLHSYDVPEFLVLKVDSGSQKYLEWIAQNT